MATVSVIYDGVGVYRTAFLGSVDSIMSGFPGRSIDEAGDP